MGKQSARKSIHARKTQFTQIDWPPTEALRERVVNKLNENLDPAHPVTLILESSEHIGSVSMSINALDRLIENLQLASDGLKMEIREGNVDSYARFFLVSQVLYYSAFEKPNQS